MHITQLFIFYMSELVSITYLAESIINSDKKQLVGSVRFKAGEI